MKFPQPISLATATSLLLLLACDRGTTTWASPLELEDRQNNTVVATITTTTAAAAATTQKLQPRVNDYSCKDASHPNPVILLHGLLANQYNNWVSIQESLESSGFCTFALTYGSYAEFPTIGGLRSIDENANQVGNFIFQVQNATGASKVDLVGHSEGAFLSLYVPKFISGISDIVDNIVAISPPTHGTDADGMQEIAYELGGSAYVQLSREAYDTLGCAACEEMTVGSSVAVALDNGSIKQSVNNILVLATHNDTIVTPPWTAFVNETGVTNQYIQQRCPQDTSGHVDIIFSPNTVAEVHHWLDPTFSLPDCVTYS